MEVQDILIGCNWDVKIATERLITMQPDSCVSKLCEGLVITQSFPIKFNNRTSVNSESISRVNFGSVASGTSQRRESQLQVILW